MGESRGNDHRYTAAVTVRVPVAAELVYQLWTETSGAEPWLPEGMDLRLDPVDASLHATLPDGTTVRVRLVPDGAHTTVVRLEHHGLPDPVARADRQDDWSRRLDALRVAAEGYRPM